MGVIENGTAFYPALGKNGRFGNCLFEAAATIGYAAMHGKMYTFPDWYGAKYFKNFPIGELPDQFEIIRENGFEYQEMPSYPRQNVAIEGYRQSEKYWMGHESLIKDCFSFSDDILEWCNERMTDMHESCDKIVSLHFRFGDYVGNNFYTQLWETDYYINAIHYIFANIKPGTEVKFLVFSDDLDRANVEIGKLLSEFEKFPYNFHFTQIMDSPSDAHDLCLMSLCDAGIMANSSFSWWGNYLGKDKKIISPKSWFGPSANIDSRDIYTNKMILI